MIDDAEWRAMSASDLAGISALSDRVHIKYPERQEVLEEKFALFPTGCFTLHGPGGLICGYCFSHPWTDGPPPSLDTFLKALPENPSSYFIHDLTLDPSMQGRKLASVVVPLIVDIAKAIPVSRMALVAVNGSEPFWTRMGFRKTSDPDLQASARSKYDASAVHMQRDLT
jgi:hypothetical protein